MRLLEFCSTKIKKNLNSKITLLVKLCLALTFCLVISKNLYCEAATYKKVYSFSIRYLGVSVAEVTLTDMYDKDNDIGEITVDAASTKVGAIFFKIDNLYRSSYKDCYQPIRYTKKIKQKGFQMEREIEFDAPNELAYITNNQEVRTEISSGKTNRDFFSSLLYLTKHSEDSKSGTITTYGNYNFWETKYEKIGEDRVEGNLCDKYKITFNKTTDYATKRSDVLTNNIVKEDSSLYLWFTKSEERLPIKAEYEMTPFALTWRLNDYTVIDEEER